MSMSDKFTTLVTKTAVLPQQNIDTDQIIPARYLTTTSRDGLGQYAFFDWRYDDEGKPKPDSQFNSLDTTTHQALVAGKNFGCGSSREHAPWALADYGFRAIISSDIADIFKSNALKNGLVPVEIGAEAHQWLLDNPSAEIEVDVKAQQVRLPNGRAEPFELEAFGRHCLLEGVDPLGFILGQMDTLETFEKVRP